MTTYQAHEDGSISGVLVKTLKPTKNNSGYMRVFMGRGKCALVHRFIAEQLVENPCPEKFDEIDHINGDKTDNRASNLRWCPRWFNLLARDNEKREPHLTPQTKQGKRYEYWCVSFHKPDGRNGRKAFKTFEEAQEFNEFIKDWVRNWDGFNPQHQDRPDFLKLFLSKD